MRHLKLVIAAATVLPALAVAGVPEEEAALRAQVELRKKGLQAAVEEIAPTLGEDGTKVPGDAQVTRVTAALGDLLEAQDELAQFYRDHPIGYPSDSGRSEPRHDEDAALLVKLSGGPDARKLAGVVVWNTLQYERMGVEREAEREAIFGLDTLRGALMAPDREDGLHVAPCPDGARAPLPDDSWTAGCRFIFRIDAQGKVPVALARGVVTPVKGVEYRLGASNAKIERVAGKLPKLLSPPGAEPFDSPAEMEDGRPAIWGLIPVRSWPVYAFGEGMTRPYKLSGADPLYTRQALEARVQGLFIVKCIIWADGSLSGCRIIKPLPFMEKAIPDALATRRYEPVTYRGRPINCDYVFNIKLVMPVVRAPPPAPSP